MVITILAEPRSGSTNLANWFYFNKNFTTLFIPSDPKSKWYKNESPKDYKYNTEHLLIKEDYYHYKNYNELINTSNKIILLYRENFEEQIESWTNAKLTNNWENNWVSKDIKDNKETAFFTELKNSFKEEYLNKNYFSISYEELYYNNGFQKIVEYLNLDCVKNENFPYGEKYRINVDKRITLI
jgi:hypothetical protein